MSRPTLVERAMAASLQAANGEFIRELGTRIAALEAANAICRTDIEALMRSADSLEARNTELEAERDRLKEELRWYKSHYPPRDPAALSAPSGE